MKDHEDQSLYSTTLSSRGLIRCLTSHSMIRYSEVRCEFATQDGLYPCSNSKTVFCCTLYMYFSLHIHIFKTNSIQHLIIIIPKFLNLMAYRRLKSTALVKRENFAQMGMPDCAIVSMFFSQLEETATHCLKFL